MVVIIGCSRLESRHSGLFRAWLDLSFGTWEHKDVCKGSMLENPGKDISYTSASDPIAPKRNVEVHRGPNKDDVIRKEENWRS